MSIDKESNGVPEINVHRRTTKVNLWIIAGVLVFFGVSAVAMLRIARQTDTPRAPATQQANP